MIHNKYKWHNCISPKAHSNSLTLIHNPCLSLLSCLTFAYRSCLSYSRDGVHRLWSVVVTLYSLHRQPLHSLFSLQFFVTVFYCTIDIACISHRLHCIWRRGRIQTEHLAGGQTTSECPRRMCVSACFFPVVFSPLMVIALFSCFISGCKMSDF